MFLVGFRRNWTALTKCKSIESAIQWFQIHHRITFATIQDPAVYLSGARVSIFSTLVPRLSRLVTDRQTCNHFFILLKLKALGTLDRRAHHLSYQSGPKSPPHFFFVLTILDCFDLGTPLKRYVLS